MSRWLGAPGTLPSAEPVAQVIAVLEDTRLEDLGADWWRLS
jgi:hypothetical protein